MNRLINYLGDAISGVLFYFGQTKLRTFLTLLGITVGVSSIIGIMNVMFVSVRERTKEIGLRKAMGATNNNILVQFLSEAIAISIIGGTIGIVLVKLMTVVLASYASFPVEFDFLLIFYTFMICVFIGITSGILPARTAANLHPIDALRHE